MFSFRHKVPFRLESCRQMIQETLPIRKKQLYETYGPGGALPLIPAAQAASPAITFGNTGGSATQAYLELLNPAATAVDISGWRLAGAAQFTFRPGMFLKQALHLPLPVWRLLVCSCSLESSVLSASPQLLVGAYCKAENAKQILHLRNPTA